jgi:signal transduction histidine kinase
MNRPAVPPDVAAVLPWLETLEEGVALHTEDGTIVACNQALRRMFRLRPQETPGPASLFAAHGAYEEDGRAVAPEHEPVWRVLVTGTPSPARDLRVGLRDGNEAWFQCRAMEVPRPRADSPPRYVTLFRERDDARALAQHVLATRSLVTLGRLAAHFAHDVRNLLTVVLGNVEVLLEDLRPGGAGWREAQEIRAAAEQGARFIRQVVVLSEGRALELEPLELNSLVTGLEPLLTRLVGGGIELRVRASAEPVPAFASRSGVEQVLINLAVNAREAMAGSGRLTIATSNVDYGPALAETFPGAPANGCAKLVVHDEGPGMDAATRARVFEPYFSTRTEEQGAGLGLAIVQGVVERCGGHVDLASEPGRGTTFSIYLPMSPNGLPPGPAEAVSRRAGG